MDMLVSVETTKTPRFSTDFNKAWGRDMSIEEERIAKLEAKIAELKKRNEEIVVWNPEKATKGKCENCREDVEKPVIKGGYSFYCEKHWADSRYVTGAIRENDEAIKELEEEIKFQKTLEKVTRFNDKNLQELIKGLKVILGYKEHKYDYKFSDHDKEAGRKVLRILQKIAPQSSKFIDMGVCITPDLILSGTIESGHYRYESDIRITALDQREAYNAVARVPLTIAEAERLRSLLTECIEHVRIMKWIKKIKEKMEIRLEDLEDQK
jgi:hypothetical protein